MVAQQNQDFTGIGTQKKSEPGNETFEDHHFGVNFSRKKNFLRAKFKPKSGRAAKN